MDISFVYWSSVIGTVVTAVATVILVFVTHRLYIATQQLSEVSKEMNTIAISNAKAQADSLLASILNEQNLLILSDDRNLRIADKLISHEELDHSDEAARERWVAFAILNVQQLVFMEHLQGNYFDELSQTKSEQILDRMLTNEAVLQLLNSRGYHPRFVEHCNQRAALLKAKAKGSYLANEKLSSKE